MKIIYRLPIRPLGVASDVDWTPENSYLNSIGAAPAGNCQAIKGRLKRAGNYGD